MGTLLPRLNHSKVIGNTFAEAFTCIVCMLQYDVSLDAVTSKVASGLLIIVHAVCVQPKKSFASTQNVSVTPGVTVSKATLLNVSPSEFVQINPTVAPVVSANKLISSN